VDQREDFSHHYINRDGDETQIHPCAQGMMMRGKTIVSGCWDDDVTGLTVEKCLEYYAYDPVQQD